MLLPGLGALLYFVVFAGSSTSPTIYGLVKIVMSCKHDVKRVKIADSLFGDDKDMLEDLVAAAFNDAVRKVEATTQEKMGGVMAGMPIPPGMKLPF